MNQTENPALDALDAQGVMASQDPSWFYKQELLGFCARFIRESIIWRRSSFETDWLLFRRNADSIYDPNLAARKESWQSKTVIPMTASHRENIHAALFKMMVGARPMMEMRSRLAQPQGQDQSDNIRDMILREMEKSRFEVGYNSVLDDKTTFGSGFCRIRFHEEYDERIVRQPEYEALRISDPSSVLPALNGTRPITGYRGVPQEVCIYRGVKFEPLSIWDVFPDPKALEIKGNTISYRYSDTFGAIVNGVSRGYYFPEAVHLLRNAPSNETEPTDKALVNADRLISEAITPRTEYGKKIRCWELFGRLPKKWVYVRGEPIDDPDKLVPARVLLAGEGEAGLVCVLTVEPNDDYEGEPPIHKDDYLPVAGRFYARGIPEMLRQINEVVTETCNQRQDNIALVLNRGFAVIEKALVSREDLVSKPGFGIRLDGKFVQDVRQALMPIDFPDITASAYTDVQEMERYAQERTSANRVTLGTNGLANDQNKTATGLEILRQSAGEKFAYIGMLSEFAFFYDVFRAYWKNIYANLRPEDIIEALGPERALTFKMLTPEEIEKQYQYEPQGIFTMENKALTQQRIQNLVATYGQQPWFNIMGAFDKECKAINLDPQALKFTPEEMQINMMAQAMASGQFNMQPQDMQRKQDTDQKAIERAEKAPGEKK